MTTAQAKVVSQRLAKLILVLIVVQEPSNLSDSDSAFASEAIMSFSVNKSPICDGERDGFEEWHSKWEVFGQDHWFDEMQSETPQPDLLIDGYAAPDR
jgi:hypothetical protein